MLDAPAPAPSATAALAKPRLTIDPAAVAANWRACAKAAPSAETGAAVKADAYGLGVDVIVPALAGAGCRTFFVANAEEGAQVRAVLDARGDAGAASVAVLNGILPGEEPMFVEAGLEPILNTPWQIPLWAGARANRPDAKGAFLHVDTGMHRLGLDAAEARAAAAEPDALQAAGVHTIMSHLASASVTASPQTPRQAARFSAALGLLRDSLPEARASLANSAGVFRDPGLHHDLTRPGIALYGGEPFDRDNPSLTIPIRLEAPILQVRTVPAGESVGYGGEAVMEREVLAATVALGYADGFLRASGGRGYGVLAGRRAPILGRVSMDLITLDVSACAHAAQPGAMVEMLGPHAGLERAGHDAGTISYEVLTRLGPRCARVAREGALS